MSAQSWTVVIVGALFLLIGSIFALQGANVIGGSALMSGNSTYIYVGGILAVFGVLLIGVGASVNRSKTRSPSLHSSANQPKNA